MYMILMIIEKTLCVLCLQAIPANINIVNGECLQNMICHKRN